MRNFAAGIMAGVVTLSAMPVQSENTWPQFRGPAGTAVADGLNPPVQFGPSSNLLWKVAVSQGHSSPVISGNLIFLTGADGTRLETICIDASAGKIRWRKSIEAAELEKVHEANSSASSTPVCDGERVCAYFGSFGLVAYDYEGNEVWKQPLPMAKTFNHQGTGTSPALVGDAVILFEENGEGSSLMAFRAKDGKELWKTVCPVYNNTWSTPVSWKEAGGERVGLACAKRFSAFDAQTGKLVWWCDGLSQQVCGTPVFSDGTLYISSASVQGERSNMKLPPTFEEFVKKYDRNGDGMISIEEIPEDFLFTDRQASGGAGNMTLRKAIQYFSDADASKPLKKENWDKLREGLKGFMESEWNNSNVMAVRTGGEGDVTQANRVWLETRGVPEISSALVYGKHVYQVRSGGLLMCRDAATGKQIYEERLSAHGGYFASPVAADGRVYTVSDLGVVTVIRAGDELVELAHNELGESVKATPALAKNTIFVRSAEHLWAFSERGAK